MKKILFICIVSLCAATLQTNAQMRDTIVNMNTHKIDANLLLQKSKKQKTTAWILLSGGAGLATVGYIAIRNEANKDPFGVVFGYSSKAQTGAVLLITGGAAMVGSVPLFIASVKNKRKANLILKDETVFFNPQININHIVALGIKINL